MEDVARTETTHQVQPQALVFDSRQNKWWRRSWIGTVSRRRGEPIERGKCQTGRWSRALWVVGPRGIVVLTHVRRVRLVRLRRIDFDRQVSSAPWPIPHRLHS